MKKLLAAFLSLALAAPAWAGNCINADPNLMLSGADGDYEMTVDPADPNHVIYVSNTASGVPANIAVAQIDGTTGVVASVPPTIIATNFDGYSQVNGPEFALKPTGELGVLYANNTDGLHGVFRSAAPGTPWNAFDFNDDGSMVSGAPSLLLATGPWADYPRAPVSMGVLSYGAKAGSDTTVVGQCQGVCYGYLSGGVLTDVWAMGAASGLSVTASAQSTNRDGYVYFAATDALGNNALYEAQIDGQGGYVARTASKLTTLAAPITLHVLVAGTHPSDGSTIIFGAESLSAGVVTNVWQQAAAGGPLTLLAGVLTTNGTDHFRVEASDTELVLHYLDFNGLNAGSYAVPVSAGSNGALVVGQSTQISTVSHGAEFIWMPAAHQFALFDNKRSGWTLRRCWVNPG